MNAFAFGLMGLALVALCLIVLALPGQRRSSERVRDY